MKNFSDFEAEAFALMKSLGIPHSVASLYTYILKAGYASENDLAANADISIEAVRESISYLRLFALISSDLVRGKAVFYVSDPRNAWKAHDTHFYWMKSLHIGEIDKLPPLPDMEDEQRRERYARLEKICGEIYDSNSKSHDPLQHRHRDIGSPELFASWLAQAITSAQKKIIAVERPPRLPELAPIWVALTRRINAGVSYTRIIGPDEIVEHGLDIVTRDMQDYGIRLRTIPANQILDAFYVIDEDRLLLKNVKGRTRDGREPHFGVYTSQHNIVRRHIDRFDTKYLPNSTDASELVASLRVRAEKIADRIRSEGKPSESEAFLQIVRYGKFAPNDPRLKQSLDWLQARGFVEKNHSNHIVMKISDSVDEASE